jgi:hypothetical protein
LRPPEDEFNHENLERALEVVQLLADYDAKARDGRIDSLLDDYRRAFARGFLPLSTRAALLFGVLEAMLDDFRARQGPEYLIPKLVDARRPSAVWFSTRVESGSGYKATKGRVFRNIVAHGDELPKDAEPSFDHVADIAGVILPLFIETWMGLPNREGQQPKKAFRKWALTTLNQEPREPQDVARPPSA